MIIIPFGVGGGAAVFFVFILGLCCAQGKFSTLATHSDKSERVCN